MLLPPVCVARRCAAIFCLLAGIFGHHTLLATVNFSHANFEGSGPGEHFIQAEAYPHSDRIVRVYSEGGTAIPGVDYKPLDTQIGWSFATDTNGPQTRFIEVLPNPDRTSDRTVILHLENVSAATIGERSTTVFTIRAHGYIEFSKAGFGIDPDTGIATVVVQRIGDTSGAVSVEYETVDGTLSGASHYEPVSGILLWADGEGGPQTFQVQLRPGVMDSLNEWKYLSVQLSNHQGGAVAGPTAQLSNYTGVIQPGTQQNAVVAYHPKKVSQLFLDWQSDPVSSVLPDFSYAGYGYGEMDPPVVDAEDWQVFHVNDFGAIPDDDLDDREAIQLTIDYAAAHGGGIVQFGAGTYLVNSRQKIDSNAEDSWPIFIRSSNIIIRGMGRELSEGGTRIYSPRSYDREFGPYARAYMFMAVPKELKASDLSYGHRTHSRYPQDYYALDTEDYANWGFLKKSKFSIRRLARSGLWGEELSA